VNKGKVVMTWDEIDELPVALYEKGMWFGDFEVYENVPRQFSCFTMTDVELFVLSKRDFNEIINFKHPKFKNYFLQKMILNFKNQESSMKKVYDIAFSKSGNLLVKDKLKIFKNMQTKILQINKRQNIPSIGE
jgi:CRP-like cAMP-binding protein